MEQNREMFAELNALVGTIAKALELSEEETIAALEANAIAITLEEDDKGQRFVGVRHGEKVVRIYQGALLHQPDAED